MGFPLFVRRPPRGARTFGNKPKRSPRPEGREVTARNLGFLSVRVRYEVTGRYLTTCNFGLPPFVGALGVLSGVSVSAVCGSASSTGKNNPCPFSLAKIPSTHSIGTEHSRDTPLKRAENSISSLPIVSLCVASG